MTEVNADLATAPEKINKDAHGSWMLKITLKNPGELNASAVGQPTMKNSSPKREDTKNSF